MSKLEEVKQILSDIGMPAAQQSDVCGYTILAMANIKPDNSWNETDNNWIRIHDVIDFTNTQYGMTYKENTREVFRKQAMHAFLEAALIEDNGKATNSPKYQYRLTPEFIDLLKSFGTPIYEQTKTNFLSKHNSLKDIYSSKKIMEKMPVKINAQDYTFSTGKHNELQKAIIEEFAPRFAPDSECLYVGDTTQKDMVKNKQKLSDLGFEITLHDKMPDIVLYKEDKNWLYFIEAVTSVGPMSPQRILELNEMTKNVRCGKIYVTAFPDYKTYKKFSEQLAWETEVWISDAPEHMIHLNGDRFMGPRNT